MVRALGSALLFLAATFVGVDSASAQLFQWTPEQLIKYTSKNPYRAVRRRPPEGARRDAGAG